MQNINAQQICRNEDTLQLRAGFDADHIDTMAEALRAGATLPPITVYQDPKGNYHIADGWHRFFAHLAADQFGIPAIVHPGTETDALRHALGANAEHLGLRRTNADKRRAILTALDLYPKLSAVKIAELCKVPQPTVSRIRRELEAKEQGGKQCLSSEDPINGTRQTDFFAELSESYTHIDHSLRDLFNHTYFTIESIPREEKLETLKALQAKLGEHLATLKQLEANLKNTVA